MEEMEWEIQNGRYRGENKREKERKGREIHIEIENGSLGERGEIEREWRGTSRGYAVILALLGLLACIRMIRK